MRDPQSLEIRFLDSNGLDIAPWEQKKIERLYFREEFRRAFFDELGDIMYPPRPLEYYGAALKEAMEEADLGDEWRRVVADMAGGPATFMLPQVAHGWHLNLIALNGVVDSEATSAPSEEPSVEEVGDVGRAIQLFGADLGVIFDWGAERIRIVTEKGDLLDGDTALHAMVDLWCRTRSIDGTIAVPLSASQAVDQIAAAYGKKVIRPGRSRRALAEAVLEGRARFAGSTSGGFIFGDFFPAYDGVLSTGMAARMLAKSGMTLAQVVADAARVPQGRDQRAVSCSAKRRGHAFRHGEGGRVQSGARRGCARSLLGRMGARASTCQRTVGVDLGGSGQRCRGCLEGRAVAASRGVRHRRGVTEGRQGGKSGIYLLV